MPPTPSLKRFLFVAFETVPMVVLSLSFQGRSLSASSSHASLLQATDGVMSLALCPQVVSKVPKHFRPSEKQATSNGCFARQSICSVISLQPGISRAVHPQEFSKVGISRAVHPQEFSKVGVDH